MMFKADISTHLTEALLLEAVAGRPLEAVAGRPAEKGPADLPDPDRRQPESRERAAANPAQCVMVVVRRSGVGRCPFFGHLITDRAPTQARRRRDGRALSNFGISEVDSGAARAGESPRLRHNPCHSALRCPPTPTPGSLPWGHRRSPGWGSGCRFHPVASAADLLA
jgi:hypothetical protein